MKRDGSRRRPSLLIVDDEERILAALCRTLRREGYEIVTAESAQDALRILSARSFDLILTDHKMPGMSGTQLLAEAAECRPNAVRLLITGWMEGIPRAQLEAVGVFALINKPWDDAHLKRTLREAREVALEHR